MFRQGFCFADKDMLRINGMRECSSKSGLGDIRVSGN